MNSTVRQLKWAILGALLLAAVGVGATWYGNSRHQVAARTFALDDAAFRQSQQRLDSVYAERREIDDFLPRFNTLKSLGALGNENRLDWIERIEAIRQDLRLPRLSYSIEPRLPSEKIAQPAAGLTFETSHMKLEFALVHEGDLLRLIERLRSPAMGVFEIRTCTVSRRSATLGATQGGTPSFEGNLEGACEIDWISLTGIRPAEASATMTGERAS